jgi:hypothetical protein
MKIKIDTMSNRKTGFIHFSRSLTMSLIIICMNYVQAGEADVLNAKISAKGGGVFRIDVTVRHEDAGWDHYANRWDVLDLDGNVLGSRVLAHPHDNEQPFTRSLTLDLPEGISVVIIRAHDSMHELGGMSFELAIPKSK